MAEKKPNDPSSDLSRGDAPEAPLQGQATDVTVPGGHYVVNGVHVDANGKEINEDGSPKAGN